MRSYPHGSLYRVPRSKAIGVARSEPFGEITMKKVLRALAVIGLAARPWAGKDRAGNSPRTSNTRTLAVLAAAGVFTLPAAAHYETMTLDKIASRADVIFVGTVVGQSVRSMAGGDGDMQVTDVAFGQLEVIFAAPGTIAQDASDITLSFAGGDKSAVCCVPRYAPGQRYLLAAHFDGKQYLSAVVGGAQGSFRIMRDDTTGKDHVLTHGGDAIVGIGRGLPVLTRSPQRLERGLGQFPPPNPTLGRKTGAPTPLQVTHNGEAPFAVTRDTTDRESKPVITLDEFVNRLMEKR